MFEQHERQERPNDSNDKDNTRLTDHLVAVAVGAAREAVPLVDTVERESGQRQAAGKVRKRRQPVGHVHQRVGGGAAQLGGQETAVDPTLLTRPCGPWCTQSTEERSRKNDDRRQTADASSRPRTATRQPPSKISCFWPR